MQLRHQQLDQNLQIGVVVYNNVVPRVQVAPGVDVGLHGLRNGRLVRHREEDPRRDVGQSIKNHVKFRVGVEVDVIAGLVAGVASGGSGAQALWWGMWREIREIGEIRQGTRMFVYNLPAPPPPSPQGAA